MSVTVDDVAGALARTAPAADTPTAIQWAGWIARAYRLVEGRYGSEVYGTLDPVKVDDVVLEAVANHVRSWTPDLVRRVDVSVDDGRRSVDYHSSVAALTIPSDLWAELDPEPLHGDVFSIQMAGTPDTSLPWPAGPYWQDWQ